MRVCIQFSVLLLLYILSNALQAQNRSNASANCGLEPLLQGASNPRDAQKRRELYLQMAGALDELAQYRNKMLNKKGLIDLFPTAYYHTTLSEMEKIRAGQYQYPAEKLNQLLAFFDAYKHNRVNWERGNTGVMDEHWLQHFQKIDDIENRSIGSGPKYRVSVRWVFDLQTALQTGIDAHVNYDLERAIAYAYKNRADGSLNPQDLSSDFSLTDHIFGTTVNKLNQDIASTFSLSMADKPLKEFGMFLNNIFMNDQQNVINGRHAAWERAFSDSPTSYDLPQLNTDHQSLYHKGQSKTCDCHGTPQNYTLNKGYNAHGVDTGILLKQGDQIKVQAAGNISYGPFAGDGTPNGIKYGTLFNYVPQYPHGSLIYRVGQGDWSFSGANAKEVAPRDGKLILNINDRDPGNNRGFYEVTITTCRFNR